MKKTNPSTPIQISLHDPRYERAEDQWFGEFDEGVSLLYDYCQQCQREKGCKINHDLRKSMGENCPMWDPHFTKRTQRMIYDKENPRLESLPETYVACNLFKPRQT